MAIATIEPHYGDVPFLLEQESELVQQTIAYEQAALSANTRRTYAVMWDKFSRWCASHSLQALPASAEAIALFLGSLGGSVSFSTIDCAIAAIERMHAQSKTPISGNQDLYRRVRKGIRREHKGCQCLNQAKALSLVELTMLCRKIGGSAKDLRDRALITLGFFGALRRSELVGLDVEHVDISEKGMTLYLLQTKTSDTMEMIYMTPTKEESVCPIRALQAWMQASRISSGPIFRPINKGGACCENRMTGHAVSTIMKERFGPDYSGHSLRRGLITAEAEKGTPLHRIQQHSRHKSADMVMRYVDVVKGFEHSTAVTLGA